jgi:DNA-binding transcriptional LysR family regulator
VVSRHDPISSIEVAKKSPKIARNRFQLPQEIRQLTLGDIEAFVALSDSGCKNKAAAKKLHYSEAAISRSRRRLTTALGQVLSYHHLKPKGEIFRLYAEQINNAIHAGLDAFDRTKCTNPDAIQIGYLQTPVSLFYADTCQRFNERYENSIVIEVKIPWGHECVKMVETGDLDLALLARPDPPMKLPKGVRYRELVQYRMFCAVGTTKPHPFLDRKTVSLAEMKKYYVLMMAKEAKLYTAHIRMFFAEVGGLRRMRYCPDAVTQIDKLISGEGIALVMYPFGTFVKGKPIKLIPVYPPLFLGVGALFLPPVHRAIFDFVEIAEGVINAQMKQHAPHAKPPADAYRSELEIDA